MIFLVFARLPPPAAKSSRFTLYFIDLFVPSHSAAFLTLILNICRVSPRHDLETTPTTRSFSCTQTGGGGGKDREKGCSRIGFITREIIVVNFSESGRFHLQPIIIIVTRTQHQREYLLFSRCYNNLTILDSNDRSHDRSRSRIS